MKTVYREVSNDLQKALIRIYDEVYLSIETHKTVNILCQQLLTKASTSKRPPVYDNINLLDNVLIKKNQAVFRQLLST